MVSGINRIKKYTFLLCRIAAFLGSLKSRYQLGIMYQNGWGVSADPYKALECFKSVVMLIEAEFTTKKKLELYAKKSASRNKRLKLNTLDDLHARALESICMLCLELGMSIDLPETNKTIFAYLDFVVEKGCIESWVIQGKLHLRWPGNASRALNCFEKAAHQNHAGALEQMGMLYEGNYWRPWSFPADYTKAFYLYKKSVLLGNMNLTNRIVMLARKCLLEEQCPVDVSSIISHLEFASSYGNYAAGTYLGYMYEQGKGVKTDFLKAFSWYEKAAQQDAPQAWAAMGFMYEFGLGVTADYNKALECYEKDLSKNYLSSTSSSENIVLCEDKMLHICETMALQGRVQAFDILASLWETRMEESEFDDKSYSIECSKEAFKWWKKIIIQLEQFAGGKYYKYDALQSEKYPWEWWEDNISLPDEALESICFLGRRLMLIPESPEACKIAFKCFEFAALRGYTYAQTCLGYMYEYGQSIEISYSQAFEYYEKAAGAGCFFAKAALGCMHEYGTGVPVNYAEALAWYGKALQEKGADTIIYAANQKTSWFPITPDRALHIYITMVRQKDDNASAFKLGELYDDREDLAEACAWYEKAALEGNDAAQNKLGYMYRYGNGVPPNNNEALKWYKKAAAQSNTGAQYNLGQAYYFGNGVPVDYAESRKWFEKAALLGLAEAQSSLGHMYMYGEGGPVDYTKALKWHGLAALQGNSDSLLCLGIMHYRGLGIPQDYLMAAIFFEKAALYGELDAHRNLGLMFMNGQGLAVDYSKAYRLFQQAVKGGVVDAMINLGYMHQNGIGIPVNYTEAFMLYEQAALHGHPIGIYNQGILYEEGKGVEQNYLRARECYEQAVELGEYSAMVRLGNMYRYGEGVDVDHHKAFRLFEQAACGGEPAGQYNLGLMYEEGKGVTRNEQLANEYFEKAAEQGLDEALERLGWNN